MKKRMLLIFLGIIGLIVTACNPGAGGGEAAQGEAAVALNANYSDALSIQGQLALGTVQLEETDQAVDEAQAAELLPLWQALQSLSNSDTTATAELDAVVNQIADTMTAEQIQAIADMSLTTESLTALQESGELGGFGGFGGFRNPADGNGDGGFPAGGFPDGGVPGGGGFPGAGIPGGGGPGGGGPGGGGGFPDGAGAGEISEDDIATRQAAFDSGDFQELALTGAVINLLAQKTGEDVGIPGGGNNPIITVMEVIAEATGLTVEEVQSQTAEGVTLGEIVEANGGDLEAVQSALVEALADTPSAEGQDLEQLAADWLAWPTAGAPSGE